MDKIKWMTSFFSKKDKSEVEQIPDATAEPEASALWYSHKQKFISGNVASVYFDGEKDKGVLGMPVNYEFGHYEMAARGWKIYHDSDICKTFINNLVNWVCGSGLRLQSEPLEDIILKKYPNADLKQFVAQIEKRFRSYTTSEMVSHDKELNLGLLYRQAVLNAIISGDCLIVQRIDKYGPTYQLIEYMSIVSPDGADPLYIDAILRGNRIFMGVEVDKNNKHVAYYIKPDSKEDSNIQRIPAYGTKTKQRQAFLLYGSDKLISGVRGLCIFGGSIQKLNSIDGFADAIVEGAKIRSKVAIVQENSRWSDGENAVIKALNLSLSAGEPFDLQLGGTQEGVNQSVAAMGLGDIINGPVGASFKQIAAIPETNIAPFEETIVKFFASSIGIPYEVGLMIYKNSFSASRMSSQSAEVIIHIKRQMYVKFYRIISNTYLEIQILKGYVKAPGYIDALNNMDIEMLEAWRNSRWVGPRLPQADPVKEVKANILQLQNRLKTHEMICEESGSGDFDNIVKTIGDEIKFMKEHITEDWLLPPNAESSKSELPKDKKVLDRE